MPHTPKKSCHGICLPLFALHSRKSGGIGEYPDLIPLINWCAALGLKVIQLLPLNDTGPGISPYSAISAFALNPIHLGLNSLPDFKESTTMLKLQAHNMHQHIAYEEIRILKEAALRRYFIQQYPDVSKSFKYREFVAKNAWIQSFATFKALKEQTHWRSWRRWPKEKVVDPVEVAYHRFIQYLCFEQMKAVLKRAEEMGVLLKGDIPILISSESADVWRHAELFHLDLQGGAPPDRYIPMGQNWGFPVYNWKECKTPLLQWWRERLQTAERLYHLYRLDHVVGLFRIWAIPKGEPACEGFFLPKDRRQWLFQGKEIIHCLLESSTMLPIAEDLGTVPDSVRCCLTALGIPGTKVMRWERKPANTGPYIPFNQYPRLSMTTVSTHDTETLQQWWQRRPEEARLFADFMQMKYQRSLSLDQRREILSQSHQTNSLFHINLLQEYFPLIPGFTWPALSDERINNPSRREWKNWRYRFKPSLEEIVYSEQLAQAFRFLLI